MTLPTIVTEFREGLSQGRLLIQQCQACARTNMYPRYACPHCQSEELGWAEARGGGTLLSFTVLHTGAPQGFEAELPYAMGVVRLEEGVQLLARLEPDADGSWAAYRCDDAVRFVPKPAADVAARPCATFRRGSAGGGT